MRGRPSSSSRSIIRAFLEAGATLFTQEQDGLAEESYKPKKLFTLEEANKTLPLVSRIIGDIVRVSSEMQVLHAEAERLAEEGRSVRAEEVRGRFEDLADQVTELAEELNAIGCVCKDPRVGLVDYPALMHDRVVFLCWKRGETEIEFWHELQGGFAGRKKVKGALG